MRRVRGYPAGADAARIGALAVAGAAWLVLLGRWFHDPAVVEPGGYRVSSIWPFAVAAAVAAALAAVLCRDALSAMKGELLDEIRLRRRDAQALATVLAFSLLYQLPTMLFPAALLHADASINGLMALHIAEGRVAPAFFYGQEFMGTFFSHVLALVFAITGPFVAGTTLLTWVFYAGFLVAVFLLVRRATNGVVAFAVGLWLALPPPALILTLAQSEYAQLFLLASWAVFLVAARVARLRHPAWWVVAGALFGLAFWSHAMGSIVAAAAVLSVVLLLGARDAALAGALMGGGFVLGVAPGLVGWGARIGRFAAWFLEGGGRGDDATLAQAFAGLARVSFGNLFFGAEGRELLPWIVAGPFAFVVVASAVGIVAGAVGLRLRPDPARLSACAAALPLALFVLLQLGVLLGRGYSVVPSQYVVPLYIAVPAVVATGAYRLACRWTTRPAMVAAAAIVVWAAVPLPSSVAWLRTLPANQATMSASLAALRAAGVDACIGPYWDAYRISYLTLEEILCESIDVRRVPGYPERVTQRARPGRPSFVAAPQRGAALDAHRESFDRRAIPWTLLRTPRFDVLLPRARR